MSKEFTELKALFEPSSPEAQETEVEQLAALFGDQTAAPIFEDEDKSLMDRWKESHSEAVMRLTDLASDITGLTVEQAEALKGSELTPEEYFDAKPTPGGALLRTVGFPVTTLFDYGSDVISEGFQEVWDVMPDHWTSPVEDAALEFLETPTGKQALDAMGKGMEYWETFKRNHPQEAALLQPAVDLWSAGSSRLVRAPLETTVTPLRLTRTGRRRDLSEPTARDKDVFNVIRPVETKAEKEARAGSGQVTAKHTVIPTENEWETIDLVKKLPVSGGRTMQENVNTINDRIATLGDKTQRLLRRKKGQISNEDIDLRLNQNFQQHVADNPAVWGTAKNPEKLVQSAFEQMRKFIDEQGNTYEGLLVARQQFDDYMLHKLKTGTWSDKKIGPMTEAHRIARNTLNDLIAEAVPESRDLLRQQHLLYGAADNVARKAGIESRSIFGRMLQAFNIHAPSTPLAQYSTFAAFREHPILGAGAVTMAPAYFLNNVRKRMMESSKIATPLAAAGYTHQDVVKEIKKVVDTIKDPKVAGQLHKDLAVLNMVARSLDGEEE